jgi:hypothetical protein
MLLILDIIVEYLAILSHWNYRIQALQLELRLLQLHQAYPDATSSITVGLML